MTPGPPHCWANLHATDRAAACKVKAMISPHRLASRSALLAVLGLSLSSAAHAQRGDLGTGPIRILAPATKGGGYDTLAQNLASVINDGKLAPNGATVYNLPGDGGVAGMKDFAKLRGQPGNLMVFGLTTIGALSVGATPGVSIKDVTPIARLTTDYEVLVVPASSAYKTVGEVLKAQRSNPENVRFGGASSAGAGQLYIGGLIQAGGGNPASMRWVESSGNLQALKAMQAGELDAASVSYGVAEADIKSGKLRALALSAPTRVSGIDVPTAREQGLATDLVNWRGVFAPAGLSDAQLNALSELFSRVNRSTQWRTLLRDQKQASFYQPSISFGYTVDREYKRIDKLITALKLKK